MSSLKEQLQLIKNYNCCFALLSLGACLASALLIYIAPQTRVQIQNPASNFNQIHWTGPNYYSDHLFCAWWQSLPVAKVLRNYDTLGQNSPCYFQRKIPKLCFDFLAAVKGNRRSPNMGKETKRKYLDYHREIEMKPNTTFYIVSITTFRHLVVRTYK